MTWFYERMAGLTAAVGVLALMAGLASMPREAQAIMGLCDNTCNAGSPLTSPPCQTSGTCVVAAGAPAGTVCTGCNFQTLFNIGGGCLRVRVFVQRGLTLPDPIPSPNNPDSARAAGHAKFTRRPVTESGWPSDEKELSP